VSIVHVGHIKAKIENRFRDLIDVTDVPNEKQEDFFLTRGLAAFVIAELCSL